MTRAFVAIRPPEEVLDAIASRASSFSLPDARRTIRGQWHLTLQFLGNDVDIDAVADALGTLPVAPGEIRLTGAGAIGNPKRARVFALFVDDGREWVHEVATQVAARLAPIGYEPDDRAFLPHVTLARCRRGTNLSAAIAAVGPEPVGPSWRVGAVTLFQSHLGRGPAVHEPRAEIPLTG